MTELNPINDVNKRLERDIAYYCAPVIVGIKSANTIMISSNEQNMLTSILEETELSHYLLYKTRNKSFYYIYRSRLIKQTLQRKDVISMMQEFGYQNVDLEDCLTILKRRYNQYINKTAQYPHEIGFLLDYPVNDVIGFIQNNGKDSSLCGYWKVYSNVEYARFIFSCYDYARETVVSRIVNGESLNTIFVMR